ncbi:hypothetical protein [Spirosoma fluviale]|uniref:Exopolysaccharide biosynthesis protein YbjH n=1 Tax=Spirosoma fluviale TaxID=1597977 RepID=A0A286GN95_9BACT|nr:hypothetical protein [Spirosoma fluviale]SOD96990.1 hypothetical protein SAMN06269250_5608 [Spirosoma fluviale]
MKKLFLLSGLLGSSLAGLAQQTIFSVPSSDIVPKHKIMAQQQVDINGEQMRFSTTVDYGLGRDWEVGVNLYNVDYQRQERTWLRNDTTIQVPYAPLLLINAQRTFNLTDALHIGLGGQTGLNLFPTGQRSSWEGWGYANLGAGLHDDHYQVVVGGYAGNRRYLAEGSTVGGHMGFDAGVWYQKVHFLGDWATGTHEYGQLVLGVEVYLQEHLPLALGWRRSNQDGNQGVVVQLTYTPR